jgi:hypothetical protein
MSVGIGSVARSSFPGNICFEFLVLCLCSVVLRHASRYRNVWASVGLGGGGVYERRQAGVTHGCPST